MKADEKLILASGSPRRRELLTRAGVEFEVVPSEIDEIRRPGEIARDYALRMALEKALAVSMARRDRLVLGADTIVECDHNILEKPQDSDDARRMLSMLSGRIHTVITGFAFARDAALLERDAVMSAVTFRKISRAEIDRYIATGEPFDKAGSYGIQGIGVGFIAEVKGSRDNVMGLPTRQVVAALERQRGS